MEVLKRLTMLVLLAKQSIFVLCTQAAQIMFTHQNHQMRTLHAIQQILETKRKIRRRKRLLLGPSRHTNVILTLLDVAGQRWRNVEMCPTFTTLLYVEITLR